nr:hypothetical protein [uncultured Noviherbaspirillum sp.]
MQRDSIFGRASGAASVALLSAFMMAGAAHAQEISLAEKILFQSDHLHNVANAQVLRYSYVRKEKSGPGFSDQVQVDVGARGSDGSAAVSSRFLTGERQVALPPVAGAYGNPALLGFLERDIGEMKRMTGGSASYFRKRIRLALAEAARVEEVAVAYAGRQLKGRKIVIQPYLHDPMQEKMQKYLAKNYVFILSDEIPGSIYQIRSTVPGGQQGDQKDSALIEETLVVAGANGSS